MPEDSILDRIKKLMTLADRASNQHEAALATERMQALLQQHNLTRAEVESHGNKGEPESALTATREKLIHERSAMYTYQAELMKTISKNNFCMHTVTTKLFEDPNGRYKRRTDGVRVRQSKVHLVIGRSDNVAVTIAMYDYLIETMNRLLPFEGADRRSTDARLWLAGCADTLCDRLTSQRWAREREEEKRQKAQANTPGLVLLTDVYTTESELNIDFCRGLAPGTTTKLRLQEEAEDRKEDELVKSGMDRSDAYFVARGLPVPPPQPAKIHKETRPRRDRERNWSRYDNAQWRKEQREEERREHPSFRAGQRKGSEIGLGGALKDSSQKAIRE